MSHSGARVEYYHGLGRSQTNISLAPIRHRGMCLAPKAIEYRVAN